MIALALLGTGSPTASASGVGQVLIEPKTERPSSMSRESVMIELFNRWESKFGTTANLTWSQPASRIPTSPMTQKAIVRSHETPIPQRSLDRPGIRVVVYDRSFSGDRAWFRFAFK